MGGWRTRAICDRSYWERLRPWLTGACYAAHWVEWTNLCATHGTSWTPWWEACPPRRPTTAPGGPGTDHTSTRGDWLGSPSPTWCPDARSPLSAVDPDQGPT